MGQLTRPGRTSTIRPLPLRNSARRLPLPAKVWPYEQAEKVLARFGDRPCILFETGYGPSGLPHIGTFCEVARTSWIRQAVSELRPGTATELYRPKRK